MKIPFSQVHVSQGVLFGARSGHLSTFNLHDGSYISTWKHPDAQKVADAFKAKSEAVEKSGAAETQTETPEPPAKRQKTSEQGDVSTSQTKEETVEGKDSEGPKDDFAKEKGKKAANAQKGPRPQVSKAPERPIITHITSTADGKHVVAVSGHDKIVWVFEHDGVGNLKELSNRTMPKRPSSIFIGPDSQILCADKFGDVYGIPLIPSENWVVPTVSRVAATKPAANEHTVHSKRNLESLKSQLKHIELGRNQGTKPEGPEFEHSLLLGHVSMLTDVIVAQHDSRNYILTSDRDEHIRVSRYSPQAHVIEGFCLGHKDFVGSMTIPQSRNNILISGGGDPELFVWDWPSGKLLSKTSVLSLATTVFPETTKVAVSQLRILDYPSDSGNIPYVLAIAEDIKAVFAWQLRGDNTLHQPSIIQLPANPLHFTIALEDGKLPKIVIAEDPRVEGVPSLNQYTLALNEEKLATDAPVQIAADDSQESLDLDATEEEIRSLLYGVDHLRKKGGDAGEDGE